jgi:hypothetical protein
MLAVISSTVVATGVLASEDLGSVAGGVTESVVTGISSVRGLGKSIVVRLARRLIWLLKSLVASALAKEFDVAEVPVESHEVEVMVARFTDVVHISVPLLSDVAATGVKAGEETKSAAFENGGSVAMGVFQLGSVTEDIRVNIASAAVVVQNSDFAKVNMLPSVVLFISLGLKSMLVSTPKIVVVESAPRPDRVAPKVVVGVTVLCKSGDVNVLAAEYVVTSLEWSAYVEAPTSVNVSASVKLKAWLVVSGTGEVALVVAVVVLLVTYASVAVSANKVGCERSEYVAALVALLKSTIE